MMMNRVFLRLLSLLFHLQLQLLVSYPWSALGTEVRCIERERQALLHLKAGFVDDFGFLSSWGNEDEKRDCCQWERVRCSNRTGHVQMLYLQGEYHHFRFHLYENAFPEGEIPFSLIEEADVWGDGTFLGGKISSSLMELQHLSYLNLSFNDFEYSHIPGFFGSLHNLRYLDVSDSVFAGKIPAQLGSLSNLQYLDLSKNYLDGAIPSQLGNLSQLQYLDISYNGLMGAIPYQLKSLSSLQKLFLGNNLALKIHNENFVDTQWLSDLTSLAILDFSDVLNLNHSHSWLQTINKLPNLRELYLRGCDLPDDDLPFLDPSKFNFSSSLAFLDLFMVPNLNHSHYLLQIIGKLPNLRELNLRQCELSDQDPFFLDHTKFNFSSLTILDLSFNNIPATFLKSVGNICTLRKLILQHVSLSVDFPTILHNLSGCASYTLQELDLSDNQITGLLSDVSKFPFLKSLDLSGNQLNGIAEGGIPGTCSLNSLHLSANKLSAELPLMIQNLFGCRSTLQYLYLAGNQITGGLPDLSKFSSLKILHLDDNQLNKMLENSRLPPQLESLEVSSNSIEGGIPESFGKICGLRFLFLSNNNLTNELPGIIHNLFGCARTLEYLDLSINQINGTLPDFSNFSSLESLRLSYNQLNGEIPKDIKFPSQLVILVLASNSKLKGDITDSHVANMSKLKHLDLSFSSLSLTFSANWVPSFQLEEIHLRSYTELGPKFPKWLQTQKNFTFLDFSNSKISDTVPEWFWLLSPRLRYLNISYNHLTGTIPNFPVRFTASPVITLASNHFEGSIPPFFISAKYVDLSKNKFSSFGMFACANGSSKNLFILDLSNNYLSGQLPDCDWNNFKSLAYLYMSNNNLSGKIPCSMGSLVELKVLALRNNTLSGDLPLSLKNCTKLDILDLGENRLSGQIPSWVGNAFKWLRMLSLRINRFTGSIPLDICHLTSLRFLDLSVNNLSGEIPKCLKNFTAMSQKEIIFRDDISRAYGFGNTNVEVYVQLNALLMWKGVEQDFYNAAFFLRSIDLSSNQLTGGIPMEIIDLVELISLNLSRNNLKGKIPSKIGRLASLEFLDLSQNHLFGKIPSSLAQIDRLGMLDLSHNQLSGKIPTSTQLQSFNASCYDDNLDLCGKPLEKECQKEATQKPQEVEKIEHSIFSQPFYISMALGFITGFWGIFGSIIVLRPWRHAYFRLLNNLTDAIYVMAAIMVAKSHDWLNG